MAKIGNFVNMNKRKVELNGLWLLLILSGTLFAQTFRASADKTTVRQGETFQVYFELGAKEINSAEGFTAPDFKGFNVLGGPNQSTSMQFINGSVSASLTYSFVLSADRPGKFTIGKAFITYKGKRLSTQPIVITVLKGNATKGRAQTGRLSHNAPNGITQADIARNVFIRAIPSKTNIYVGQQLTVIYRLYTRLRISSPSITKLPTYDGFWAEDLQMPNTITFRNEMYKGVRYRVADLKKVALFPTKSGKLKITPFELNIPVLIRRRTRNLFDDFFNDPFFSSTQTYNFKTRSNSLLVNVKPLPVSAMPQNFSGAVGSFSLKFNVDKHSVKVDEPITIKLKISGTGNINLIQTPVVKLPAGFEQYEPKVTSKINKLDIVSGFKSIEYLVIPRIPGSKIIPPIKFTYFNPAQKKYITLKTKAIKIEVTGKANTFANRTAGFTKEDIKLLNTDIRFIKTSNFALVRINDEEVIPLWYYWSLIIPVILLAIAIVVKKRREKITGNRQLLKSQRAEKLARKRLKKARKALDAKQSDLFYEEIYKALSNYLSDKLNIAASDFTLDKVKTALTEKGISEELQGEVETVINRCEFARYAPSKDEKAEENLYSQTLSLISNLEKAINRKRK